MLFFDEVDKKFMKDWKYDEAGAKKYLAKRNAILAAKVKQYVKKWDDVKTAFAKAVSDNWYNWWIDLWQSWWRRTFNTVTVWIKPVSKWLDKKTIDKVTDTTLRYVQPTEMNKPEYPSTIDWRSVWAVWAMWLYWKNVYDRAKKSADLIHESKVNKLWKNVAKERIEPWMELQNHTLNQIWDLKQKGGSKITMHEVWDVVKWDIKKVGKVLKLKEWKQVAKLGVDKIINSWAVKQVWKWLYKVVDNVVVKKLASRAAALWLVNTIPVVWQIVDTAFLISMWYEAWKDWINTLKEWDQKDKLKRSEFKNKYPYADSWFDWSNYWQWAMLSDETNKMFDNLYTK